MTAPPEMFNVRVTFDAREGAGVVGRPIDALDERRPELAKGMGVSYSDGYATMELEPVPDDPTAGPTSADAPTPGAEIAAALEGFSQDVVPAPKLHQDVLSSHRSGAAPPPEPRFGASGPASSTTLRRD
jgi:hypothetical protein